METFVSGEDYSSRDLRGLDFSGLDLRDATFEACDLQGASFRGTILDRVNFSYANLVGVDFTGARFYDPEYAYDDNDFESDVDDFIDDKQLEAYFERWEVQSTGGGDGLGADETTEVDPDEINGTLPDSKPWAFLDRWFGLFNFREVSRFIDQPWMDAVRVDFVEGIQLAHLYGVSESDGLGFLQSWRRSMAMLDDCAFFVDCSHDTTTIWPDQDHLRDFPFLNQPPGKKWSATGLMAEGSRYAEDAEPDFFREWEVPEGLTKNPNLN